MCVGESLSLRAANSPPPGALPPTTALYLLQDEIQADTLLPVNVRVPEARQLLGVPPVHLHLHRRRFGLSWLRGTGQR